MQSDPIGKNISLKMSKFGQCSSPKIAYILQYSIRL